MQSKITFIIILLSFGTLYSFPQIAIRHQIQNTIPADSLDLQYHSKKNGYIAAAQVLGLNMSVWAFDRYIQKADFAYINIHTMKKNIKKGFVWDNDQMGTNTFLHPYHGGLYYNAARSNGYGYWASGAFALGGSAMWELLFENEYPSINDIVATPIGGLTLGEVFYRSSDLILDNRATGNERLGREAAAFIVSPMRGITRIINGDAWRKRSTSGRQFGVPEVNLEVSAGVRILELKDKIFDKGIGGIIDINFEYGDKYETENQKPFDFFSFSANLNIMGSQPLASQINVIGRLHVTDLIDTKNDFLSIGAYQHFDYYDSDTISSVSNKVPYKFCSPASFGGGLIYQRKRNPYWKFDAYTHLNVVILGASLSDHYIVDKRNYNLASGFSWKLGANLSYKDKFSISATYEAYRMFTWKGYPKDFDWENLDVHEFNYQGDKSQAILHATKLKANLKLYNQVYLTTVLSNYTRDTNYRYFADVFSRTSEGRIMLTYKF